MVADPISLPSGIRFAEWTLKPVVTRDVSMLEGRRMESADFGSNSWQLSAKTAALTFRQSDDIEDFLHRALRGGATFAAPDLFRPRPRAYGTTPLSGVKAVGGGAFNGDGTVQSITNSRQVTVAGLPNGFVINRGCLVEFRKSLLCRSLHRVTTAVTSGAGGTAVLAIEGALDLGVFTTAATVHFEKPSCVMMLEDFDLPKAAGIRQATFSAREAFFS